MLETVSYTHLDVYKRQFLANIREVDAIVHVVRAFDDENVMREQGREDAFVDPLADIDTVSYTHLDVYKRQGIKSPEK